MELEIAPIDLDDLEVQALLARHLAFAHEVTPAGHVHALDDSGLRDPAVSMFGARFDGELVGIGALKRLDAGHAELKSMHVDQRRRGLGAGRALVLALLHEARARGFERVSLETGTMEAFAPARRLYEDVGFVACEPFGAYTSNPHSTCMTLALGAPGPGVHPALLAATAITAVDDRPAVVGLACSFALERDLADVERAVLWATAHGVYEARLNGVPVSPSVLDPGWTAYEWRLQVQSFDVTSSLTSHNELSVRLANGWYRGDLGFLGIDVNYGEELAFLGVLVVTYADGHEQVVASSPAWRGLRTDSPSASLYHGQVIDARRRTGAAEPLPVVEVALDRGRLVPQEAPHVVRQEVLRPVAIWRSPGGEVLVDFGQNLVGWTRTTVTGRAGTEVVLRHAEVLEDGELGTRPLRSAKATDTFVLSGGQDTFEPTATFHGFRYVEVRGWPGELTDADIEAVVVHSDLARTGTFECSDELVNQLVSNSVWGQKGNFLDVPTDCPQRDERLGWTGDIAAYAATAAFQFDCADLLHKWLLDLAVETEHSAKGAVPLVVPDVLKRADFPPGAREVFEAWSGPKAVWGDAAVWVPEALWYAYGDRDRLAAHYPGMVAHLASVEPRLSDTGLWDGDVQLGDWLDPDAPPNRPGQAKADPGVVATACLHRSAAFAAVAADSLGLAADATRWRSLAARTRAAFVEHYVADDGRIRSHCATVYALAICFGLLDDEARARAGEHLASVVAATGYRVSTGFAGTPYVTWALSETGHVDDAYRLLLERSCPSWLYPVTMGATTIWERWDAMLPDGSINPGEMTSFNHYALGAVADWLYKVVAGINPKEPGYARVELRPTPGPGLDWARATLRTRHGAVACGWRRDGDAVVVEATVPEGITADVVLPDGTTTTVVGGSHSFTVG